MKFYDILFTFKIPNSDIVKTFEECLAGYNKECVKETISFCYDVVEFLSIKECEH